MTKKGKQCRKPKKTAKDSAIKELQILKQKFVSFSINLQNILEFSTPCLNVDVEKMLMVS